MTETSPDQPTTNEPLALHNVPLPDALEMLEMVNGVKIVAADDRTAAQCRLHDVTLDFGADFQRMLAELLASVGMYFTTAPADGCLTIHRHDPETLRREGRWRELVQMLLASLSGGSRYRLEAGKTGTDAAGTSAIWAHLGRAFVELGDWESAVQSLAQHILLRSVATPQAPLSNADRVLLQLFDKPDEPYGNAPRAVIAWRTLAAKCFAFDLPDAAWKAQAELAKLDPEDGATVAASLRSLAAKRTKAF